MKNWCFYGTVIEEKNGGSIRASQRCGDGDAGSYYDRSAGTMDSVVRIQTKAGLIKVTGKSLQVAYYTNDEMMIHGQITGIEYQH